MTITEAIQTHGAQAVYDAASRHMGGDFKHGLASVGLSAQTMADVFAIQSRAYAEMGLAARAIDYAKAQAELDALIARSAPD
jgi:hypothetical protein